jgi:hypothetical protein
VERTNQFVILHVSIICAFCFAFVRAGSTILRFQTIFADSDENGRPVQSNLEALLAGEWVILGLWRKFLRGKTVLFSAWQFGYDFSMAKLRRCRTLRDAYRFPGFVPAMIVHGMFGIPLTRIVSLKRRQKKQPAASAASGTTVTTTESLR